MKRILSLLLSLGLVLGTAACRQEESGTEQAAIQKQLLEMEGYACSATLTRINGTQEKTYETKQYYQSTGEYRLELTAPESVAGNYTVFDGSRICQYNPRLESSIIKDVPESQQRNELFLGQFIKNYMQSEGVSVETGAWEESKCVILEAVIPGNDPLIATEKLWVDRKTLLPVRFVLYGADGEERYRMEYSDFCFNPQFDQGLFSIAE